MIPLLLSFLRPRHRSGLSDWRTDQVTLGMLSSAWPLLSFRGWCARRDTRLRARPGLCSSARHEGCLGLHWLASSCRSLHRPLRPVLPGDMLTSICLAIHPISQFVENLGRKEERDLVSHAPLPTTMRPTPIRDLQPRFPLDWAWACSSTSDFEESLPSPSRASSRRADDTTSSITPSGVS